MNNRELMELDDYEYGYKLGFMDGQAAKLHGYRDHGGLLGANDPYAIGYRAGLYS